MKVSILIPAFNEEKTLGELLQKVKNSDTLGMEKEIIIIDDGSADGTRQIAVNFQNQYPAKFISNEKNSGKGFSIRRGFGECSGDIVLLQDADLECDPENYPVLLKPFLNGEADVVFGSRFLAGDFRHFSALYQFGDRMLTWFSNFLSGLVITDMWTGFKVFRIECAREILPKIKSDRFGMEPEITALVSKAGCRFKEVALSHKGTARTHRQGKKIRMSDGLLSLWQIVKFNLFQ